MITVNDTRAAAYDYVSRGWAVMPLKPHSKDPHFELVRNAYKGATFDLSIVEHWFDFDPNTNLGIACITSGLVVIDVDFRNGGKADAAWADTYTVQTGNGLHFYYRADASLDFKELYCLDELWYLESRWNYKAKNPKSSAAGIPQLLNLKETDPFKQIDRGLKYIDHRYDGCACKALAHHKAKGWY